MTVRLILIRGLPGSGKSTLAKELLAKGLVNSHFEADMFHIQADGTYVYDVTKAREAHAWCLEMTKLSLEHGKRVVVSNTFVTRSEIWPYLYLGYPTEVLVAQGMWPSIHGVPEDVLVSMKARWEDTVTQMDIYNSRPHLEKEQMAREVIEYLNDVLRLDPRAINELCEHRVLCNEKLAHHSTTTTTTQVVADGDSWRVGLLGILNGLVGIKDGVGYITAVYGDDGSLQRFELTTEENRIKMREASNEEPAPKPKVGAGWGWPMLSKRMHYFQADHRSLCMKWLYSGKRLEVPDRTHVVPEQCKECFRRRARMVERAPNPTEPPPGS